MLTKKQKAVHEEYLNNINKVSVLDEKTQFMVKLAAVVAVGCPPCTEFCFGAAKEKGVSKEEFGAVLLHAMAVMAGSTEHRVREIYETRIEGN